MKGSPRSRGELFFRAARPPTISSKAGLCAGFRAAAQLDTSVRTIETHFRGE